MKTAKSVDNALSFLKKGDHQKARKLLLELLESDAQVPAVFYYLAVISYQEKDFEKAIEWLEKAIAIAPGNTAYHRLKGLCHAGLGSHQKAIDCFERVLEYQPDDIDAHYQVGQAYKALHDFQHALNAFKKAVLIDSGFAEAYFNMAGLLHRMDRLGEAIACYQKAIAAKSDYTRAYNNLGVVLKQTGKYEAAMQAFEKALIQNPGFADAHNNLGNLLQVQNRLEQAVSHFKKAVQVDPDFHEAYYNLGIALNALNQPHQAIEQFQQAILLCPTFDKAYNNLGVALQAVLRIEAALDAYDKAIELNPTFAAAHWNRSLALLISGRFTEGLTAYEWRFRKEGWLNTYPHRFTRPRWDGGVFKEKRLLVHHEQGYGDSIQFARYLPLVKQRGGTVIFEVQAPLFPLFNNFPGIDELVIADPGAPPSIEFDCYAPLLSLPCLFQTSLESIPCDIPYLYADEKKASFFNQLISKETFNVGIAWAGRESHQNDRNRSCGLKWFATLCHIEGVRIYGLQKGAAVHQIESFANPGMIVDLSPYMNDFADTAAAVVCLDLVICVDTALAHLAGAMGKPVWILHPFAPDWRWMLSRKDSPWYPTARLFRQPGIGVWKPVFASVVDELKNLCDTP